MKRYEEYKDSGIEWLGEIPSHWDVDFLKNNYSFEKGKNAGKYTKEYIAEIKGEFPVYSGQTENEGVMGKINTFEYDVDECIFSTTVGAKAMTPMFLQGKFTLSQNCLIMNPRSQKVFSKYIYYILIPLFNYEKGSIPSYMQPSLRIEDLKRFKTVIPTLQEQQQIASYLDYKTSKIDELISKKEELVETLKNARQKLISETITKGLDKGVKMKDSGVEWIGEIPKHWKMTKIKREFNFLVGGTPDSGNEDYYSSNEGGFKWATISDINKKYINDTVNYISKEGVKNASIKLIPKNSLLFSFKLSVGKVAFNLSDMYTNEAIATFLSNSNFNNLEYAFYSFPIFIPENANENIYGSKILNQELIKNALICLPPLKEQEEIASYLNEKTAKIDRLISKTEKQIEILKKAKQSLITEVVTGKIDVRGWTK